jgi:ATP-dependent DNA helicase DinG
MNEIRDITYFSLDLELNALDDDEPNKIIQVGVSIGSPVRPDNIKTYSWYLDPEDPITPFITQLTGIDDELIKLKAVSHETVAEELGNILKENECFVNPIVWGQGDADELKAEFRARNIYFPFFGRRIFDVKTLYVFNQITTGRTPSGSLKKSMNSMGINFVGLPHRADVDAENTLRFFFYLIDRQRKFEEYKELMRGMK